MLIERRPEARQGIGPDPLQGLDRVSFSPQCMPISGDCRQLDHFPAIAAGGLLGQEHAGQIFLVHAVIDQDDCAARLEPVVGGSGVPIPDILAFGLAHRVGHVGEGIIDKHDIGAAAHDLAANADRVIDAAAIGVPLVAGLAVLGEAGLEQDPVFLALNDVPDLPAEIGGELGGGRHADQLLAGMTAKIEGGEAARGQFRFAMPWRDQEHQPIDLATLDPLEVGGNGPVVLGGPVKREGVFGEADQALPGLPSPEQLGCCLSSSG